MKILVSLLFFFQIASSSYAAESTGFQSGNPAVFHDNGKMPQTPPDSRLHSYCREKPWTSSLQPAVVEKLSGADAGIFLKSNKSFPKSTLDIVRVVPQNPFWVTKIRAAFAKNTSKARLRLMGTFGRSYPACYAGGCSSTALDLLPLIDIEIKKQLARAGFAGH